VSGCTLELAPAVAAASLLQSGALASAIKGSSKLIQQCPDKAATRPDPATRQALDDKVLCAVMCCCSENPNTGKNGASLYDGCAAEVLRAADAMLGWKSRYKAQVGYDMQQGGSEPPSPFMHRGPNGSGTQPSQWPLGRAMQEIENFAGSRGKLRIPDVTIVDDLPAARARQHRAGGGVEVRGRSARQASGRGIQTHRWRWRKIPSVPHG